MEKKLFNELMDSVREGGSILRGYMKDMDYASDGRWASRDKKRRKKRYGMVVDGQSIRLIDRIIGKKAKKK